MRGFRRLPRAGTSALALRSGQGCHQMSGPLSAFLHLMRLNIGNSIGDTAYFSNHWPIFLLDGFRSPVHKSSEPGQASQGDDQAGPADSGPSAVSRIPWRNRL